MSTLTLNDTAEQIRYEADRLQANVEDMMHRCKVLHLRIEQDIRMAESNVTPVYFPRVKMTTSQRIVLWIKKVVR